MEHSYASDYESEEAEDPDYGKPSKRKRYFLKFPQNGTWLNLDINKSLNPSQNKSHDESTEECDNSRLSHVTANHNGNESFLSNTKSRQMYYWLDTGKSPCTLGLSNQNVKVPKKETIFKRKRSYFVNNENNNSSYLNFEERLKEKPQFGTNEVGFVENLNFDSRKAFNRENIQVTENNSDDKSHHNQDNSNHGDPKCAKPLKRNKKRKIDTYVEDLKIHHVSSSTKVNKYLKAHEITHINERLPKLLNTNDCQTPKKYNLRKRDESSRSRNNIDCDSDSSILTANYIRSTKLDISPNKQKKCLRTIKRECSKSYVQPGRLQSKLNNKKNKTLNGELQTIPINGQARVDCNTSNFFSNKNSRCSKSTKLSKDTINQCEKEKSSGHISITPELDRTRPTVIDVVIDNKAHNISPVRLTRNSEKVMKFSNITLGSLDSNDALNNFSKYLVDLRDDSFKSVTQRGAHNKVKKYFK